MTAVVKKGITMNQPATMPTTLTLVNPIQDDAAQAVEEMPTLTALEERQNFLAHHVRLVTRKLSSRALRLRITGRAGQESHCAADSRR